MAMGENAVKELPERAAIRQHREEQLGNGGIDAAVLERDSMSAIRYRILSDVEVREIIRD